MELGGILQSQSLPHLTPHPPILTPATFSLRREPEAGTDVKYIKDTTDQFLSFTYCVM